MGGNSVVQNGRVVIDGRAVTDDDEAKVVHIEIRGDVAELSVDVCETLSIVGAVDTVTTQSGNVRYGDVSGSVKTMSGNILCDNVAGSVKTMSGNIRRS